MVTLSPKMSCRFGDLRSKGIAVVTILAGAKITCSDCFPNSGNFLKLLKQIKVGSANEPCASVDATIVRCAFSGCKLIKEIEIPDSVTTVEEQVFADCKVQKNLILSDNMSSCKGILFRLACFRKP